MLFPLLLAITIATPDLRLELTRESLSATHQRYRQYIDGVPVVGGEVNVTERRDGHREEHRALAQSVSTATSKGADVWVNDGGVAVPARRMIERGVVRYVALDGEKVIRRDVLEFPAKPARVFDPNPVVKLNAPELRDDADAASAVPPAAYSDVELQNLRASGPLGGAAVQISDFQGPFVAPVDASSSLIFDRSESGFEDVNAYFHIDRAQTYLQSLGFVGPRRIAPYAIETDTHAAGGADDSFFIASALETGRGRLQFGEGGTDDAEDSDLIVHEYAHAIHEWISPGTFLGSFGDEARAISEGFGDYWAFSAKYAAAVASGRDPFCIADWDARCWTDPSSERCAYPAGADCLRRTDGVKTIADYVHSDTSGVEHRNGEIWSAALVDIFVAFTQRYGVAAGKRAADSVVIESLFGTPPRPGFATIARQMLVADQYLFAGTNRDLICAAMTARGILSDCVTAPRGEFTMFPGSGSGIVVPDNDPNGVTLSVRIDDPRPIERVTVSVDIRHRGRGELRVALIAPDGTVVRLHEPGPERAPDLITTFGRDSLPVDSLDVLRGRSALGEWKLRVVDVAFADVATIVHWSLNVQFEDSRPEPLRPFGPLSFLHRVLPVVGHAAGANGTFFRTDLRLLHAWDHDVAIALVFTPAGADGTTDFATVRMIVPPNRVVALDDVVRTLFASGGIGQLEIISLHFVDASARVWTEGDDGTYGLASPALPASDAIVPDVTTYIGGLRTNDEFRTNLGFAEVSGQTARVFVELRNATSSETFTVDVPPHSLVQVPVSFRADPFVAVIRVEAGAVLAYGAVVDNDSGDPMLIHARRPDGGGFIFPAINGAGANGTNWRTELTVVSTDERGAVAEHSYRAGANPFIRRQTSAPYLRVDDAVIDLFGAPNSIGIVNTIAPANIIVTARVWTEGPRGTYGMTVGSGGGSTLLHVENSERFRTNIGLYSFRPGGVGATLFDADGNAIRSYAFIVEPFQLLQFPITDRVVNGRVRINGVGVSGYAAVVDNITGDAIFVPAR